MAMSASTMWSRIKANISAVTPVQTSDPATANSYRDAVGQAMCAGIIAEIIADAVVTVPGVQTGSSTVSGTVSS